jgi:hypothetical protein
MRKIYNKLKYENPKRRHLFGEFSIGGNLLLKMNLKALADWDTG